MSDSAIIKLISYDEEKLELRLAFADDRVAIHRGVPSSVHVALLASSQQVAFYAANIREQFPRT